MPADLLLPAARPLTDVRRRPDLVLAGVAPAVLDRRRTARSRRRARVEPALVFLAAAALYLAVAAYLVLAANSLSVDALSRVANGSFVVLGRDPHLAAVGFVWNPLPSLLVIPLLLLHGVWPALLARGFAGNIVSALVMAAAVTTVRGILADQGVRRGRRLVVTVGVGLCPMVVYYAANGMSEAYLLLSTLVAVRALGRWYAGRGGPGHAALVVAGTALGVGYLARYEAAVAGLGAVAVVAAVSWRRGAGADRQTRAGVAVTDALLVGLPVLASVVLWAGVSWVVVGAPFQQFTSQYGNAAQVLAQGVNTTGAGPWSSARTGDVLLQLVALEPMVAVALGVVAVAAVRRRTVLPLLPLAVFGPVLAFEAVAYLSGSTFGWLRFMIYVIPLVALAAAPLLVDRAAPAPGRPRRFGWRPALGALAAVVLLAPGWGGQVAVAGNHRLAREEAPQWNDVVHPQSPEGSRLRRRFDTERQVAAFLDAQRLPDGSVLVDAASGFGVLIASRRPAQFVATPDLDFPSAVAGLDSPRVPAGPPVRYVLDVPSSGLGRANAVNVRFPSFYADGAGIATLSREFPATSDQPPWRLYQLRRDPTG